MSGGGRGAPGRDSGVVLRESGVDTLVRLRGRRRLARFAGSAGASSVAFRGISPDPATAIQAVTGSGLDAVQVGGIARSSETAFYTSRTFSTCRDARDFDAEVRRQRRAGSLAALAAGAETLGEYVTGTWAASHAATLAAKTRLHYASLCDHHLRP
jgi:hypothetical protein